MCLSRQAETKTHIYMEEITFNICHFIMLYLVPLKNMSMPTNIPELKTTGLRGSNVWHKSGIIKDYSMDLTQNIITLTQTNKLLHNSTQTSDFHLLLERQKAKKKKKIHRTKSKVSVYRTCSTLTMRTLSTYCTYKHGDLKWVMIRTGHDKKGLI